MGKQEGPLVLCDISGYTSFITSTEMEHSEGIITELLDTIVASLAGRLELAQLEGDAVFMVGDRTDAALVDALEGAFVAFHRRLRAIRTMSTCPCQACSRAPALTLKEIAHHGAYSRQRIGGVTQVHGPDVIVPHRLAKNTVPSREYILACPSVTERIAGRAAEFTPHDEVVPDFGAMTVAYKDLAALREQAYREDFERVPRDQARVYAERVYPGATRAGVWRALVDPEHRRRWQGASRIERTSGARGSLLDAEFHCYHGPEAAEVTVMRVTGYEEGSWLTQAFSFGPRDVYFTVTLADAPEGVRLTFAAGWLAPGGDTPHDAVGVAHCEDLVARGLPVLGEIAREEAAASRA